MKLLPKAKSNSFFSNSVYIFLIRLFPSVAGLLIVIYYSRNLTKQEYGMYQNFWIQLNVLFPLACFGVHVFIITYPKSFILKLLRSINTRQYILYGCWLLIPCCIFAWLQWRALHLSFIIPLLFIVVYSASFIFESFLIVCKNYKGLTVINLLYALSYWMIHLYVLVNGFSLQALFTYLLILCGLKLCIYCGMTLANIKEVTEENDFEIPMDKARNLWLHLGLYDVLQLLFSWIDKFIISLVLTAALSAVYFNGSMNIPVLPLLLTATGSAVLMQLASGKKQDETQKALELMNQSARVLSCIIFPAFFFLLLFRNELFMVLLPKYMAAVPVFLISTLVLPLKAYSFTTILQNRHKGGVINAGAIADLVFACALMYPLYKLMGLPGVALSFVVTTYAQAAFYLYYTARTLGVKVLHLLPFGNWLTKLIVFFVLFIAIHYITTQYFTEQISLILGISAAMLTVVAALYIELKNRNRYGPTSSQTEV